MLDSFWDQLKTQFAPLGQTAQAVWRAPGFADATKSIGTTILGGASGLVGIPPPIGMNIAQGVNAYRQLQPMLKSAPKKKTMTMPTASTGSATGPAGSASAFGLNPNLDAAARKMGGYTDTAMGEMRNRQFDAENMLRVQMNRAASDPAWNAARRLAMENAKNPGIPKAVLDRLQGRVAARSAASTAAGLRGVMARAARGGMGDSAVLNASQLAINRGAINRQNGALDLDRWAAERAASDRQSAISQLAGVAQGQQAATMGPLRDLVSTMGRYDPLRQMQQVQGIMSPLQGVGYGVGLQGVGGGASGVGLPAAPMPTVTLPKKPTATAKRPTATASAPMQFDPRWLMKPYGAVGAIL